MAVQLWSGQAQLFLTERQYIALQAAANKTGAGDVSTLFQEVLWGMATDLLRDAGVGEGDSGPTVYDKVYSLLVKEEGCRG